MRPRRGLSNPGSSMGGQLPQPARNSRICWRWHKSKNRPTLALPDPCTDRGQGLQVFGDMGNSFDCAISHVELRDLAACEDYLPYSVLSGWHQSDRVSGECLGQFEDLALEADAAFVLDAADLMFGARTRWAAGPRGRDAGWVGTGRPARPGRGPGGAACSPCSPPSWIRMNARRQPRPLRPCRNSCGPASAPLPS